MHHLECPTLQQLTQLILSVESFRAGLASERTFSTVDHLVASKVVLLRESTTAYVARVRLLARMRTHVVGQLALVGERRSADIALRRLRTVCDLNVDLHPLLTRK